MTKSSNSLRRDKRVESLERVDGAVDDEYKWDLFLVPGYLIKGYGSRDKFCRNLSEVEQFVTTAVKVQY